MRIVIGLAALGAVAACGAAAGNEDQANASGSEVTVVLPPPAPPVGEGEADPARPSGTPAPVRVGTVSGSQAAWAPVLRRVGFPCERVTSVQEAGSGYRVECAGGGPYRASRRDGRIKFSKWRQA